MQLNTILKWGLSAGLLLVALLLYDKYEVFYGPNVPSKLDTPYLYVPTGITFDSLVVRLREGGFIEDEAGFRETARWMEFDSKPTMRAGRFRIEPGWSNQQLIRHLRGGKQAPVRLVLNNHRLLEDVAARCAQYLEPDSAAFARLFYDRAFLQTIGYTPETLMALFIPNTYEFFWNTTPEQFLERMQREHERFWSQNERLEKARALGLSPVEVYTLASIVEKETNRDDEKPRMAGVYLNRLRRNMLLQADPTAVFARRDFETSRVTDFHTKFDSPYNTYKYPGLPPGPIYMASIASIDAVLNAEKHDYLYFCARGDGSGYHSFAKTLRGHNQNVARYRRNLRNRRNG
ncbi:MAG: endolytic transglycosylase MltG [Bacteroidetes bacterium]|nr:MAG: endolytic transglycosylase MltG [Bacteroidota bacterium]